MSLYKNKYRIESARLAGWDYSSPGYYFITVCACDRARLFGDISDGKIYLNECGAIVQDEWDKSFIIRHELLRDAFVVMPNHFHGIVRVVGIVETSGRTSLQRERRGIHPETQLQPNRKTPRLRPKSISSFMAGIKSVITKRINEIRKTPGAPVLQYRFHDHIVRDENELFRIRQYIINNPINWERDKLNGGSGNRVSEESMTYGEEPWMI